jgi:hypothetical protein
MTKSLLYPLKGSSLEDLTSLLLTLTDKKKEQLEKELEYYLLCYPMGTGDDELEDLMDLLSELMWPD